VIEGGQKVVEVDLVLAQMVKAKRVDIQHLQGHRIEFVEGWLATSVTNW